MGPWGVVLLQACICAVILRGILSINAYRAKIKDKTRKTMIVLGSGGHTTEMFQFLRTLSESERKKLSPRLYVVASSDKDSDAKVREFEQGNDDEYVVQYIPRSRQVGQSFFTSIFTTLWAIIFSFKLVWSFRPDIILANGPGTCLPICFSAFLMKILGRLPSCCVFLAESYACINHPSLTTRLLYPFIDVLFVQWTPLMKTYKKAIYTGRMPLANNNDKASNAKSLTTSSSSTQSNSPLTYCLVTVGTTQFNELIQAVDSLKFCDLLKQKGFSGLHVQYGCGDNVYIPTLLEHETDDFQIKVFGKIPSLSAEIAGCSMVIGHAGVGTIFESLGMDKRLVVVPNTRLMNNHQLEIANELKSRDFLSISSSETLLEDIGAIDFSRPQSQLKFPIVESTTWKTTIFIVSGLVKDDKINQTWKKK